MDASKLILDETRLKLSWSSPGYGGQVACYSSSKKLGQSTKEAPWIHRAQGCHEGLVM